MQSKHLLLFDKNEGKVVESLSYMQYAISSPKLLSL